MVLAVLIDAGQPAIAQQGDLGAVQRILDRRAQAIRSGDRDAFLRTLDPEAAPAFRNAQARSFDGWRALPLERYALEARIEDGGNLARAAAGRHPGVTRSFLPETRQRYRLEGYDDRDAVDALWLTFVLRKGSWYVASDTDLEDLGLDTTRNLWELAGGVRLQPTAHFLLISHPAQAERAAALAAIAEDALAELSSRWDLPWSERVPFIVPASVKELEVMLQSTVDLDKFVAFVSYGATRSGGTYTATAPRMYVQDRNLSRYPRRYEVETLVHELTHAAGAVHAGPFTPSWVHEGLAEWVAEGRPSPSGTRRAGTRLPRDFEFVSGSGGEILGSYEKARTAVAALAAANGVAVPTRLFRDLGAVRWAPGNQDHLVDASLRRTAGLGTADLEAIWTGQRPH